jgi:hypothetical protein
MSSLVRAVLEILEAVGVPWMGCTQGTMHASMWGSSLGEEMRQNTSVRKHAIHLPLDTALMTGRDLSLQLWERAAGNHQYRPLDAAVEAAAVAAGDIAAAERQRGAIAAQGRA